MKELIVKSIKPTHEIERLIAALVPFAEIRDSLPNKKISYLKQNKDNAYLILEGFVNIHRLQDGMIMCTAEAPVILGLVNKMLESSDEFYFSTKTRVVIGLIPWGIVKDILDKEGLWECYSTYLTYIVKYMSVHSSKITALSAYEVIRNQLTNLANEPNEFRLTTNAMQYIQERSRLSRSRIMSVLSQLRKGGYIVIEDGVLIELGKLPEKY